MPEAMKQTQSANRMSAAPYFSAKASFGLASSLSPSLSAAGDAAMTPTANTAKTVGLKSAESAATVSAPTSKPANILRIIAHAYAIFGELKMTNPTVTASRV